MRRVNAIVALLCLLLYAEAAPMLAGTHWCCLAKPQPAAPAHCPSMEMAPGAEMAMEDSQPVAPSNQLFASADGHCRMLCLQAGGSAKLLALKSRGGPLLVSILAAAPEVPTGPSAPKYFSSAPRGPPPLTLS